MFDLLQSQANDNIPIEKFKAGLEKNAFQSKDLEKLIMLLDTAKTRKTVNMKVLNTWLTQLRQKEKPADSSNVQTRFG